MGEGERMEGEREKWVMYFIYMCVDRVLKPVEIILSTRSGMKESDGRDEPNQGTL